MSLSSLERAGNEENELRSFLTETEEASSSNHLQVKVMLILLWDERNVCLEHRIPRETLSSVPRIHILSGFIFNHKSNTNCVDLWVNVPCNMTIPILPAQRLEPSRTCTSSVYHICRIPSSQLISSCMDDPKRHYKRTDFQVRWRGMVGGA